MAITNQPTLSYGIVTGRFLLAYTDGVDQDGELDWAAAKGSVLFTPSAPSIKNPSLGITFMPATVECVLNSEGYIVRPDGAQGIKLLATDNPDNDPINWTWGVDFRLTDQAGAPIGTIEPFSFSLPASSTPVDISDLAP
jgi:hypothetical protein